ncbi:TNF receptor-associated factor 4-like [Corticium candelabrum]|uniref:TNF receptor-associated factor 4-like n=1 Tax=Corticium candelabrum TaxID=121492 RepID=UPI002E275D47|nr:TNF receptor-associated factor 4-like [Corticium candelabrum]
MNEPVKKDGTCPNRPLECEFSEADCQFTGNSNELKVHLQNEVVCHLSLLTRHQSDTKLLLATTKSLLSSTRACLAKRECELENLKLAITKKGRMSVSQSQICVFEWNVTSWSYWMTNAQSDLPEYQSIRSKSFYTGPQGYHLYLKLYPLGYGFYEGSHVSVDVCVRKGDYDDQLPKKQHSKFSFTLIDQQSDAINVVVRREKTVELIPGKYFDATDDFITQETLNSRSYIQNNEIFIQFCLQLNVL